MLDSIKDIQKQYETGENPVLVMCSDKNDMCVSICVL